jgi:hypothetical protein
LNGCGIRGFLFGEREVARDRKDLRKLCERFASEPDPVKLRELIAQLGGVLQVEEEHRKDKSTVAESSTEKNQQSPTQNPDR